jgi:hypothetical protein
MNNARAVDIFVNRRCLCEQDRRCLCGQARDYLAREDCVTLHELHSATREGSRTKDTWTTLLYSNYPWFVRHELRETKYPRTLGLVFPLPL